MTVLRDDTFARRGRRRPRRRYVSALVFVLIFISLALLVLSRLDHPYVAAIRQTVTPALTPVLTALSGPLAPVRRLGDRLEMLMAEQDEIAKLRAEVQQLRGWQWKARDLERQLAALSDLNRRRVTEDIAFVTARVIADSRGPFARSVVIDAGQNQGLREGFPVVNADGLIGRIVDVTPEAARVLLLTDAASRIPVEIGTSQVRAIATGNNGPDPNLKFLPRDAELKAGQVIATSGRGGLFPRALRVGTIDMQRGRPVLKPFARLDRIEFVSVLKFDSPALPLTTGTVEPTRVKGRVNAGLDEAADDE